jgi:hypothetical protein
MPLFRAHALLVLVIGIHPLSTIRITRSHIPLGSVQIRLREWEGVLDQFDPRFRVLGDDNFNHVEAEKYVGIIQHSEPGQRTSRNSFLFCAINCFDRPAKIFARPRFYFDKHERVIVAAHNVDFAATASTEIAEEDFVTATLQEPAR